jgi:hypothetical protein
MMVIMVDYGSHPTRQQAFAVDNDYRDVVDETSIKSAGPPWWLIAAFSVLGVIFAVVSWSFLAGLHTKADKAQEDTLFEIRSSRITIPDGVTVAERAFYRNEYDTGLVMHEIITSETPIVDDAFLYSLVRPANVSGNWIYAVQDTQDAQAINFAWYWPDGVEDTAVDQLYVTGVYKKNAHVAQLITQKVNPSLMPWVYALPGFRFEYLENPSGEGDDTVLV